MALILITNDDGYASKGLRTLVEVAKEFGEVVVVAPDGPRSASSHAITMNTPLRLHHYHTDDDGTRYFRTNGTPCDCVKLGLRVVLRDRPADLVLSGINHGSNSSVSLIYSGTMGAAVEATLSHVPAIGFSLLDYHADADFTAARHYVRLILQEMLRHPFTDEASLNVNIPNVPLQAIKGVKVTRQAKGYWQEEMVERTDPYGGKYYWLTGRLEITDNGEDTCEWALQHNYVSVQPVQNDFTHHAFIPQLKFLEEI
jgi:5'-nucleotidase